MTRRAGACSTVMARSLPTPDVAARHPRRNLGPRDAHAVHQPRGVRRLVALQRQLLDLVRAGHRRPVPHVPRRRAALRRQHDEARARDGRLPRGRGRGARPRRPGARAQLLRLPARRSVFSIDPEEDSDPEPWRHLGEDVALRWLCYRAIVRSSNLATNLVLDAVGTTAVAAVLDRVGARDSTVTRGIEDATAREAGLQNVVTAADLARTLQALWSGDAALPRRLPGGPRGPRRPADQRRDPRPAAGGLGGGAQVRLDRGHLARRRHRPPRGRGRRRAVRLRHVYDVRPRRADRPRPHRGCRGRRLHGS